MRQLTKNALKVLETRYLVRDQEGNITETPEQLFRRVARTIASVEPRESAPYWEERFFQLMSNLEFLPNTPTLVNAGRDGGYGILSACFVLPLEDHMEDIFETLKRTAVLHQQAAGTGYCASKLRPEGSTVSKRVGVASGPVSWMKVFNAATEEVKQGGTRRGAMLFSLHDSHPDIFKFITCKKDVTQMKNANISVAATDAFMEAVEKDLDWVLKHPNFTTETVIKARDLWKEIIDSAWSTGDPGLLFCDEANRKNPTPHIFELETTNPCGEQWLGPNESCNLGSINLIHFIDPLNKTFDANKLRPVIHDCVRLLDNVIDVAKYPFKEMDQAVKGNRKIGLGIMGWADMLLTLGISYDSEEALVLADNLGAFLQTEADSASRKLAEEKGSFPNFLGSIYDGVVLGMRNACRTTIAPTGTISLIANETSSGIEPVFAFNHKSNRMDTTMDHSHWFTKQWIINHGQDPLPNYCVEAHQIAPEWHIKMQATWQKYIDNSISKTINLPNSATREDIEKAYMLAWKLKLKGVTVFRDGCKSTGQVLEHVSTAKTPIKHVGEQSTYTEVQTGYGPLHVHINSDKDKKPYRLFLNLPPIGTEISGLTTTLGIVISKYLEQGGGLEQLIKHLGSVTGDRPIGLGPNKVLSIPHAIAKTFKEFLKQVHEKEVQLPPTSTVLQCPECHSSSFKKQEGCSLCPDCGFSSCS